MIAGVTAVARISQDFPGKRSDGATREDEINGAALAAGFGFGTVLLAHEAVDGAPVVAGTGSDLVGIDPTCIKGEFEDGVGSIRIEIAGEKLRKVRRVERSFSQDHLNLFFAGALTDVVEVGIENTELAPRGTLAQAEPIHVARAGRLPRERPRKMGRLREPKAAGRDELITLAGIEDGVLGDAVIAGEVAVHFGTIKAEAREGGEGCLKIDHLFANDFLEADQVRLLSPDNIDTELAAGSPAVARGFVLGQSYADIT